MDPHTLYRRRDEFQILDVREDDEWAAGRVAGSLHIPLGDLAAAWTNSTAVNRW